MKSFTVDIPLAIRDLMPGRPRRAGEFSKETETMRTDNEATRQHTDPVAAARGQVAVGGVWRSGRFVVAMALFLMAAFTFVGLKPTESEAYIGWCRLCAPPEAVDDLTDTQISLPQATTPDLSGVVDVYIPASREYPVSVRFMPNTSLNGADVKSNALRLVVP